MKKTKESQRTTQKAPRSPLLTLLIMAGYGFLMSSALSGCSETELFSHYAKQVSWPGQQENAGKYKVGDPYRVGSVWYYPREDFRMVETGIASWYGPDFHGKHTANGEVYDQNELTAAHRTLQMPSLARVTNLENGRSVVVRINDRGPYLHGRVMDVSKRAAELLGYKDRGTARVRIEVLEKESRQIAVAAKRGMNTSRMTMADLEKMDGQTEGSVALASAQNMPSVDNEAETLPESLKTPTITVEELTAPAGKAVAPVDVARVYEGQLVEPTALPVAIPHNAALNPDESNVAPPVAGRLKRGHFMPDPVVSNAPVSPTGLFIQAGAFASRDNAENLSKKLAKISKTIIEPVTVGGKTLYRVKLGPISSIDKADGLLEKVIRAGQGGAKVVKK